MGSGVVSGLNHMGGRGASLGTLTVAFLMTLSGCVDVDTARDTLPVSCLDRPRLDSCGSGRVGYYYDYRDDRCKPIQTGGCEGSGQFRSLRECIDFCGARP
ncbi:MAG: proteinase inhibitor I4 serpin [Sphingobacteriia bacterium]|nr:proteinase inhibitor I4 serpin [Sphingobacteriia bacterium]NCC37953.1 proteinase inhibitor I4 serpin [Gammaproteobacteria bacterium]